jgi:hypothetical protein
MEDIGLALTAEDLLFSCRYREYIGIALVDRSICEFYFFFTLLKYSPRR